MRIAATSSLNTLKSWRIAAKDVRSETTPEEEQQQLRREAPNLPALQLEMQNTPGSTHPFTHAGFFDEMKQRHLDDSEVSQSAGSAGSSGQPATTVITWKPKAAPEKEEKEEEEKEKDNFGENEKEEREEEEPEKENLGENEEEDQDRVVKLSSDLNSLD